jgi:hypothetical protein
VIVEIIIVICAAIVGLDIWASWRIFRDDLSSWAQRWGQLAFVWLVPLIGALVTLQLQKKEPERGSGEYRERGLVTSNKSLERTVNHCGRTVRAFAVCARAGVEVRSWPAVQHNR